MLDELISKVSTTSNSIPIVNELIEKDLRLTFSEAQAKYGTLLENAPAVIRMKFANCISLTKTNMDKYGKQDMKKQVSFVINSACCWLSDSGCTYSYEIIDNKIFHSIEEAHARLEEIYNHFNEVDKALHLSVTKTDFNDTSTKLKITFGKNQKDGCISEANYEIVELHD